MRELNIGRGIMVTAVRMTRYNVMASLLLVVAGIALAQENASMLCEPRFLHRQNWCCKMLLIYRFEAGSSES